MAPSIQAATGGSLEIRIAEKARGKQPAIRSGGRFYTPPETREFQRIISLCTYEAMLSTGVRKLPAKVQVHVGILAKFKIPEDAKERRVDDVHLLDPDCDNIAKMLCDGMQGTLYPNDNCVVPLYVDKRWSDRDEIIISVRW